MLGRLDYNALPFYSPVAFGGAAVTVLAGAIVLALITYFRLWGWLWKNYLTTVDHKKIGIMYVVLAIVLLLRGFADAIMMRLQQMLSVTGNGYLEGDHFQQVFSAHGTIMIFFVAMPFMSGLANIIIPQQIGARDVAFPFLNALSFWLTAAGAGLVLISLVLGEFSAAGWTGYPPFAGIERSPGTGVDYWLWAVFISGWGSTLTGINFLVTIIRRRAPGMTLMRLPMFIWTMACTSAVILLSFPPLTVVTALLMLDRIFGMHFFTADMGGNFMNYANLLWMWGHPEVYILVLPAFGIFSEVASTFSRKALYGYRDMVYATAVITVLSMLVWLHHFFTMGSSATVNAAFGIATMIIGIPTGLKVFNWLFTMYKGRIEFEVPIYWLLGFMILFVIGGATGVMHAIVPLDYNLHNTTFLVAHFHNMIIPGVLFGYLAGYYYWFPKAMGFRLHAGWGKASFWGWFIGFILAFMPLYVLGMMGLPRRVANIPDPRFEPLLIVAFIGACCIAFGIFSIVMQLLVSIRQREALRDQDGDPWDGRTLEWSIPSPPPEFNFARIPIVHSLDALTHAKANGGLDYGPVESIQLPRQTPTGLFIGGLAFLIGFGAVWHMWWLLALGFVGILVLVVQRSFIDHDEFEVSGSEVREIMSRSGQPLPSEAGP
ncbi:MAG: cbb3-type cytochrome c oxidase subunit I [Alphaproteobacteria bacterium]|nr:cbb3-type cytochrome c oxidase subunit I [Alphaproteobacteria bacterium]MCB9931439.1 cbb3-type cytochrome c oxidase subunit I [Alphaproteobacteria bacterium]